MSTTLFDLTILALAAFSAGLVDAVVGGGGLIQLPTLFAIFPNSPVASLLGTNKLASIFGTGAAAVNYARQVKIPWSTTLPATLTAFVFAFIGAFTVTHIPPDFLRKLLPFILIALAIYTFRKKGLGQTHAPKHGGNKELWIALAVGAGIGFYDGFFGPGTGSFLLFLFVRFFGFDFLSASACAKVVNVACNLAALLWFGWSGHVLWQLGLLMAACQIGGSLIGTKLAVKHGSGFIRKLFLLVVCALIVRTAWQAFFKG
jgi:uncharacterized membrane protein YfcA